MHHFAGLIANVFGAAPLQKPLDDAVGGSGVDDDEQVVCEKEIVHPEPIQHLAEVIDKKKSKSTEEMVDSFKTPLWISTVFPSAPASAVVEARSHWRSWSWGSLRAF